MRARGRVRLELVRALARDAPLLRAHLLAPERRLALAADDPVPPVPEHGAESNAAPRPGTCRRELSGRCRADRIETRSFGKRRWAFRGLVPVPFQVHARELGRPDRASGGSA